MDLWLRSAKDMANLSPGEKRTSLSKFFASSGFVEIFVNYRKKSWEHESQNYYNKKLWFIDSHCVMNN